MAQDDLFFDAVLMPNRSLGPQGFLILMGAVSAVGLVSGLVFYLAGAWPVVGFLGLEVLLLYLAFRISYRRASIVETLRLTREYLTVERTNHWGDSRTWRFSPAWLQIGVEGAPRRGGLVLRSHGRSLKIGGFLTEEERLELAEALRAAQVRACAPCRPSAASRA